MFLIRMFTVFLDLKMMIIIKSKLILWIELFQLGLFELQKSKKNVVVFWKGTDFYFIYD
jgi:hypothetical protein